ncbi:two component transcriptional regulator, LuxR family [endosymbiont of Ridgeia piscesae]|jgi:two-component system invasion response regulator UvrY|uniref:Two component transcriptional regulator, LuxR family n=1 Tax=endosymbiont of Ridgeia piscesae TaxID=54398 RepID=A0A0T5YZD7_9GAMM|nr:response regulator [endosymbiont of Ridgeia piscesae]KRT55541.1 two component transcriptional regulator, LuxR family [endosymbiont of Ridgeia piscesae]
MIRVLLVDDHELVRTGVKSILTQVPDISVVGEAGSGETAIQMVQQDRPDVVLMDVNMPGIGGIEATRRLLRIAPDLKVVALTMLDNEPFPARLNEVGAMGYLTKGCPADEMIQAIRSVFRGQPFVSSDVARKHILTDWKRHSATPFQGLSSRETQVMLMILEGQRNQEISDGLSLSPKTVSTYRQRIYEKLDVRNDVELTRLAYRHGILSDKVDSV